MAVKAAILGAPHIDPVSSSTSASSMPVVWRSITVRAETVISVVAEDGA